MLVTLLLTGLVATTASAAGLLGDFRQGSLNMAPRGGFRLPSGDINGEALVQALTDTLLRYNSTPFTKPYTPTAEEQVEAAAARVNSLLDPSFNATHAKREFTEALSSNQDIDYDGYITVGSTKPTRFLMQFDTGSPHIVVPGIKCTAAKGCPHFARYFGLGTPLDTSVSLTYSGGTVTGFQWADQVTIAGLNVTDQTIVSLVSANMTNPSVYDGIVGMSFSAAAKDNTTTYFENLLEQKLVSVPEFSFFLGRAYNNTGPNSQLTLGGRNTSQYTGAVTSVPVVAQTAWLIGMDGITVNGQSAGSTIQGQAAIDTGTSFVVVPLPALTKIFSLIPGSIAIPLSGLGASQSQLYAYPCNTPAAYIPSMTMSGRSFPIALQDFSLGVLTNSFVTALATKIGATEAEVNAKELCVAGLIGLQNNVNPNLYVLGDVFLKGWYSVFGYGEGWPVNKTGASVGFAQVRQDAPALPVASAGPVSI